MTIIYLEILKAGAKHELLFNEPAIDYFFALKKVFVAKEQHSLLRAGVCHHLFSSRHLEKILLILTIYFYKFDIGNAPTYNNAPSYSKPLYNVPKCRAPKWRAPKWRAPSDHRTVNWHR
jgi:hypothetical protein